MDDGNDVAIADTVCVAERLCFQIIPFRILVGGNRVLMLDSSSHADELSDDIRNHRRVRHGFICGIGSMEHQCQTDRQLYQ